MIANLDGSAERLLSAIPNSSCFLYQPGPNWSPDGKTIAVPAKHLGKLEGWALAAISVADGSVREFFFSSDVLGRPVWLPGGNALLVPVPNSFSHHGQLWTISYPLGEASRLTLDIAGFSAALDRTRDGRAITALVKTLVSNVWSATAGEPSESRQITFGELALRGIAETADGRILPASEDGELWVMKADGTPRELFTEVHGADWPALCVRYVVLASHEAGIAVLTRVDANGSHPTRLASGNLWIPACSPDGEFVFYFTVDHPQKIWRVPIDGGAPKEIAEILGDNVSGPLHISPDGRFIAYPYSESRGDESAWKLAVIPVAGGSPIRTFTVLGWLWGPRWSPDGKSLQ